MLPLVLLVLLAFVVVMWLVLLILRCDCCVVAVAVSLMGATAKGQKELKSEFKQKIFVMIVGCVYVCVCVGAALLGHPSTLAHRRQDCAHFKSRRVESS